MLVIEPHAIERHNVISGIVDFVRPANHVLVPIPFGVGLDMLVAALVRGEHEQPARADDLVDADVLIPQTPGINLIGSGFDIDCPDFSRQVSSTRTSTPRGPLSGGGCSVGGPRSW